MSDTPTFREIDFLSVVVDHDPDHYKHDEVVYKFSNKREFTTTDHTDSGIYDGS
jgi:hypothetical protein